MLCSPMPHVVVLIVEDLFVVVAVLLFAIHLFDTSVKQKETINAINV